jgi:type III secretory pathway component EscV
MLPMSIFFCLVSNVTRVYLPVSYVQCYPCLSFCVLCPMLPVSIFLCLVSNDNIGHKTQNDRHDQYWTQETERETRVTLDTRHRKIDTGNIGHKTQKDRHGVTHVYLSLSCVQCYTCLSSCVLCPMLPVSIFLCLVFNVTCVSLSVSCAQCCRVYLSVSCVQCYPCLFFCVLCSLLPVSIFLRRPQQKTQHRKLQR